ncbi:MAG: hypothetical protein AMXMBFR48_15160 [Ignavibacteriales bacterium]
MRGILLLVCFLFPAIVFSQSFGGNFVMPVKRDIIDGRRVDYANFYLYVAEGSAGLRVYQQYSDSIGFLGDFTRHGQL